MKFFAAVLLTGTLAAAYSPCPSGVTNANPVCCSANVEGIVSLDCRNVPRFPKSADQFKQLCARLGLQPQCCTLDVAEQGVVCSKPVGV